MDTGDFDALSASWLFVLPSHARDIPRACFEFKFSGVRFIQSDNALNHLRNIGKLDDARFSIDVGHSRSQIDLISAKKTTF